MNEKIIKEESEMLISEKRGIRDHVKRQEHEIKSKLDKYKEIRQNLNHGQA